MLKFINGSDTAIIVLHEIYGINMHIEEVCQQYSSDGYDVYCPNLLNVGKTFDYSQQNAAYEYFTKNVGFNIYLKVNELIKELRPTYKKIILLGFSIGATVAWRCTEEGLCDAIIGCYGSRIRDYLEFTPKCPALLIFAANEKSFNPNNTLEMLRDKENIVACEIEGSHGFCDKYCENYDQEAKMAAEKIIYNFLKEHI